VERLDVGIVTDLAENPAGEHAAGWIGATKRRDECSEHPESDAKPSVSRSRAQSARF